MIVYKIIGVVQTWKCLPTMKELNKCNDSSGLIEAAIYFMHCTLLLQWATISMQNKVHCVRIPLSLF